MICGTKDYSPRHDVINAINDVRAEYIPPAMQSTRFIVDGDAGAVYHAATALMAAITMRANALRLPCNYPFFPYIEPVSQ